jgi:hypothetical protein
MLEYTLVMEVFLAIINWNIDYWGNILSRNLFRIPMVSAWHTETVLLCSANGLSLIQTGVLPCELGNQKNQNLLRPT